VDRHCNAKVICADRSAGMSKSRGRRFDRWIVIAVIVALALMDTSLVAQRTGAAYQRTILAIQQLIEKPDLGDAQIQIDRASKLYPADGGLENLRGVVEIQQGHTDEAVKSFSNAILHDPKLTSAYLNLGRVYMQSIGKTPSAQAKALNVYERALAVAPANTEANYQAAVLMMLDRRYKVSLEHIARLDVHTRSASNALAVECADQAGLAHNAEAEKCAVALAAHPELTEEDAAAILPVLLSAHRADLVLLILARVEQRGPLSPASLRALGLAQESTGKLKEARDTLERAFAGDSNSTAVLVDLARVARTSKDYQGALGYLAHARDMEPSNASLPYYFGLVSLDLGLLGESRKALAEAARLAPDNPSYNFSMGVVSSFAQDPTIALPYLQKYHSLRPTAADGVLALGTTYFRAKDFETAETWLKKAALNEKTANSAHYYLGRIARQQGRLDDSITELNQALAIKPDQPDVLSELGQVLIQLHRYPDAESKLHAASLLSPNNYAANFGLLQLYARTGDTRREEQAKRFDQIQSENQSQYQEMMRIIEIRPQD
jgi:tetratricopeptide (TPR) repeat protein